MKPIFKLLPFAVMLLLCEYLEAQRLSLDSILGVVRNQNPMLKSYTARAAAMNAYAKGAGSWMAPEVGGGLWMLPYKHTENPSEQGQYMLSVQQKFINPAKLNANKKYLESKAAIDQANEGVVYNELRAQAKSAYYQWAILEKKKVVIKQNKEIVTLVIKMAQLRFPYNQSKLSSIYKAEARLQEIDNLMLENETQIVQKNILLNQLMNAPTDWRYSIDTTPLNHSFEIDSPSFVARHDIQRIDYTIQSMKLNQAVERSQSKPDFNLSYSHMISRNNMMPNQFMLLAMVSIPIAPWSSKLYKSNMEGINGEIEALKNDRAALLNELKGSTATIITEINSLNKQIENYEKRILPALRKNYEIVMLGYQENKEELPIVIDAWETLNLTQLQHLDALQKYYEAIVTYEKQIEK